MSEEWLNGIVPAISACPGCGQGENQHFEGDVAAHTALVFMNLLTVCREKLQREADFIERLAALLHDWKKPEAKTIRPDGSVSFPGHEALAAAAAADVAARLGLTEEESAKLLFLVAEHGAFHDFPKLATERQQELRRSPFCRSACALQMADAMSGIFADGSHLPVHWDIIQEKCS